MSINSKRTLATIMFTDMVGYTALMQRDEQQARLKRDRHREVFDTLHEKFGGQIIQYFGDGTLSIFESSVKAVACAEEMQNMLQEPIHVPLRIGIHSGEITIEEDNIIGDAVNLASRIESFAVPGAVFVSDTVYDQVKNQVQFDFKALGKFNLKNVARPFEIYALSNEGLEVPGPESLKGKGERVEVYKDNLPKVLTSFIGREKEIQELKSLLTKYRLITLTGPGGTGKTRLSIQTAREVQNQFRDGVIWVPLASVLDPEIVAYSIAKHLGLKEDPLLDMDEVLVRFFKPKQALLVLDNYEQIVKAADIIGQLLEVCAELQILVSSRVVLQIAGEKEYQVPPLSLPKLNGSNSLEKLEKVPSIVLFTERANASRRNFQLSNDNITAVAEICIRLDGLPLAIELAAARTKIFKPQALLERLNKSLDLLKGSGKLPERHQTLRQTIAWSYNLLDSEEKELFQKSAVFVGGCTMEALEIVCGSDDLANWDVIDGVMALVDKSLLQSEETEDDTRFFMLETIREFAVEALNNAPNVREQKMAHIHYFLELAEEAGPHFRGPEADYWTKKLSYDEANCRAVIDYSIELDEIQLAYRMIQALQNFWSYKFMPNEAIQLIERVVAIPVAEKLFPDRQKIKQMLARYYLWLPLAGKAVNILEENLRYWEQHGDKKQLGLALNDLGWGYDWMFRTQENLKLSSKARAIFEELNETIPFIASLVNISVAFCRQGKPGKSLPLVQRCLALNEEHGDIRRHVYISSFLGLIYFYQGKIESAESTLNEALKIIRSRGFTFYENLVLCFLGYVYFAKSEFETCINIAREIEKRSLVFNSKWGMLAAYQNYALAALGKKQLDEANHWGEKLEKLRRIMQAEHVGQRVDVIIGKIAAEEGDSVRIQQCIRKLMQNEIENESYSGFIPGLEISARFAERNGNYEVSAQLFYNAQALRKELETPIFQSEASIYTILEQRLRDQLETKKLEAIKTTRLDDKILLNLVNELIK